MAYQTNWLSGQPPFFPCCLWLFWLSSQYQSASIGYPCPEQMKGERRGEREQKRKDRVCPPSLKKSRQISGNISILFCQYCASLRRTIKLRNLSQKKSFSFKKLFLRHTTGEVYCDCECRLRPVAHRISVVALSGLIYPKPPAERKCSYTFVLFLFSFLYKLLQSEYTVCVVVHSGAAENCGGSSERKLTSVTRVEDQGKSLIAGFIIGREKQESSRIFFLCCLF